MGAGRSLGPQGVGWGQLGSQDLMATGRGARGPGAGRRAVQEVLQACPEGGRAVAWHLERRRTGTAEGLGWL